MSAFGDWLFWEFGASGTGSHYGLLSGALSDLGEVTLIGSAVAALTLAYRHLNCRRQGCKRLGLHNLVDPDTGERIRLCHEHHSHHYHITADHLADVAARIDARRKTGDPTVGA